MKMWFGETTRGSGMVFTMVYVEDAPADVTLTVSNATSDGSPLPCGVYPFDRFGGYVLNVPVLQVPQAVRVVARDGAGSVLAEAAKTVDPRVAKVLSRFNTARRNPVALAIRNSNRLVRAESTTVKVMNVIKGVHGDSLIHGSVSRVSSSANGVGGSMRFDVLGPAGTPVQLDPWTVLSDDSVEDPDHPGIVQRTVQFSVPIPASERSIVLWARGGDGDETGGFLALQPHMLEGMREAWRGLTLSADRDPRYEDWFLEHHRASARELEVQRVRVFNETPVFSIVVPLFRTPLDYFHEMVESVLAQTYPRFELILVNASPEDGALSAAVASYVADDDRIKEVRLDGNRGITLNTNEGIRAATGDFVAFFDHDDVLEPDILYSYAEAVNAHPDTDLLYCDEDKLVEGHYRNPFFKPDWSPDLLLGFNYVTHMLTVRRSILEELGELPGHEFDGAQDYNMTFLASERARNIFHARKVLYHWRVHPGSTAASSGAKSYTSVAGVRALQGHLDRTGIAGTAQAHARSNDYYVDYRFDEEPLVSIVIPNMDMVDVLSACIDSIREKTIYSNYEIVVVENNSCERATFDYYDRLAEDPRVRVVTVDTGGKFNFSKVVNHGFSEARGDYLLMLNNDTAVIEGGWLTTMMGVCQRPEVGVVGAKLLFPDKTIQHAGVGIDRGGPDHLGRDLPGNTTDYYNIYDTPHNLSAVTGACLLTKRDVFEKVGGLDESFASDYNDVDYCMKVRDAGYLVTYDARAVLFHYESLSRDVGGNTRRLLLHYRERGRLIQRWPAYWAVGDPYLSPSFRPGTLYRNLG
ncbi:glycosyltransferase family 2 protein [Caniella muris]|uniref:glycosyltransferase family 2 protein n=1 Tax=Caniella muris TaxID=2941502 RepID=UPI0020410D54|nr:glycosyltransferase family 2 protein [Caniella muris]